MQSKVAAIGDGIVNIHKLYAMGWFSPASNISSQRMLVSIADKPNDEYHGNETTNTQIQRRGSNAKHGEMRHNTSRYNKNHHANQSAHPQQ
eukprot:scaffold66380_cov41-Prasinocladus_malaysianus.AAC.1